MALKATVTTCILKMIEIGYSNSLNVLAIAIMFILRESSFKQMAVYQKVV